MTADTLGGVWSYAMELCTALGSSGVEIALATLGAPLSSSQRLDVMPLTHVQVYEGSYRLEWMPDPWASLAEGGEWLLALERQIAPDVIHLNHLVHADLDWQAPVVVVGHSCVYSWWAAVRGGKPDESWLPYHARVTRSLRCADRLVAPSRAMLQALCRHYGPFRNTQVIPNARDPFGYRPAVKEPFVFCAGRLWDEAKNVDALCAAAPFISWPVIVAGADAGPNGERRDLPHLTHLRSLGTTAISRWMARAAIYASPARYEPFGLGVLEAGLSGCALVLSNLDSQREIWERAALYVTPGSAEDLRDVLTDLITHPRALPLLGKRARARAEQFHPQRFGAEYLGLYRALRAPKEVATCDSYCSITH